MSRGRSTSHSPSTSTLYMETTVIPVSRSIAEIHEQLSLAGATQIIMEYAGASVSALSFAMVPCPGDTPRLFTLPVRVDPIYCKLVDKCPPRSSKTGDQLRAQAERIAWRQLSMWVKAQMALVQLEMVEPGQVFLPYLLNGRGETMWQSYQAQTLLLAEGKTPVNTPINGDK